MRRTIEIAGLTRSTLVFEPRVWRFYLGLGGCAIVVAFSLSVVFNESAMLETRFAGALVGSPFAVSLALGVRQLRYRRFVALLREGIYTDSTLAAPRLVPWDAIESVGISTVGLERWLGLQVSKAADLSGWSSGVARAGRTLSGWDVTYSLSMLKGGDALPGLVERYVREPETRRELG